MSRSAKPIPDEPRTVAPYLAIRNGAAALELYKTGFGAVEIYKLIVPDGRVGHAEIRLGDSLIIASDDVDAFVKRAVAAGVASDEMQRRVRALFAKAT